MSRRNLVERVRWDRHALRRAQSVEPLRRLAQRRFEPADAEPGQGRLHPVDDPGALADQAFSFTARTLGVLLLERWDRHHPAVAALATQPSQEHTHEHRRIQPIGLRPAMLA